MTEPDVAFLELADDCFPFTVEAFPANQKHDTDPLYALTVEGPGVINVPPLKFQGRPVRVVIRFANGRVERTGDLP